MNPISFDLPDIGLREISGTLSLDDEFLVFHVQDAFIGEFDKEHMVIKVEPQALQAIRFDRGIIRDRICIQPKKRDLLTVMPGTYAEELQLKIWNTYRADAKPLVEEVQRRMKAVAPRAV
jgi:hypothetical protein